jgi:hypothetical protein
MSRARFSRPAWLRVRIGAAFGLHYTGSAEAVRHSRYEPSRKAGLAIRVFGWSFPSGLDG